MEEETLESGDGDLDVELSIDSEAEDLSERILKFTNLHKVYLPFLLKITGLHSHSLNHGALCPTMMERGIEVCVRMTVSISTCQNFKKMTSVFANLMSIFQQYVTFQY